MPLYIDWQPSDVLCHIGPLAIRYYALAWIGGIFIAYLLAGRIYCRVGVDPAIDKHGQRIRTGKFDPLVVYCFIGVLIGARLGHCIFYEPAYYLTSLHGIIEMLLPIQFDPGGVRFTGYAGLASHGGVVGLLLALLAYVHWAKLRAWWVLDVIGVVAPATGCCIRLGNLMNSEIVGKVTDVPWAFIFHSHHALENGQLVPRHPAQLYEAIAYALILAITLTIYLRNNPPATGDTLKGGGGAATAPAKHPLQLGSGFYFGFCLAAVFTFRFFIELIKEVQGGSDDGSTLLNMGQMLSIPVAIAGIACILLRPGMRTHKQA